MTDGSVRTAFVLGGGGSRGSFEIGALTYLYGETDLQPDIVTGCSIGAVIASRIATSRDRATQADAVKGLEHLIRGFADHHGMFAEEPWFADVSTRLPAASGALHTLRGTPVVAISPATTRLSTGPAGLNDAADGNADAGRGLSELWSAFRTLTRTAREIQPMVRSAFGARSLYNLEPLRRLLEDPEVFGLDAVSRSGVRLRLPLVSLQTGDLRYVTEEGTFVDRDNEPLPELGHVPLADAVRASAAVPGVFPSVRLGEEDYVDGGVREILPLEIAVNHLGAEQAIAIMAQAPGLAPRRDLHGTSILPVVARALGEIALAEIRRDDVAAAHRTPGVTVIEPQFDVHSSFEVDPDLIGIAVDYGWMRAADVMTHASVEQQNLSRELAESRTAVARGTTHEDAIAKLLDERPPHLLPPNLRHGRG